MRFSWVALSLVLCLVGWADAGIHRFEHQRHRGEPLRPSSAVSLPVPLAARDAGTPYILGFYPYWASGYETIPFTLLDELVYFGADVEENGDFSSLHGWPDAELIAAAHPEGCRVTLTLILFSPSAQRTLLSDADYRDNLTANAVAAVVEGGGDGINVDFELLPNDQKQNFVLWLNELAGALEAALPGASLTVDTPAVDWAGSYDYDQLASVARLMIMAYDYHWPSGDPGPVAPLLGSDLWGDYAWDWTVEDYRTYLAPYDLTHALLGMPFYGYDWPSAGPEIPGTAVASADAWTILAAGDVAAAQGGGLWDAASLTPYVIYQDKGWRQCWYEDLDSLALKLDFAAAEGLGGVGFWTATYAGDDPGIWGLVEQYKYGDDDDDNDVADDDDDDAFDDDAMDDDAADDDLGDDDNDVADDDDDLGNDDDNDDDSDDDDNDNDDDGCCGG